MSYKEVFQLAINKGYNYYFTDVPDLLSDNVAIPIRMQLIELTLIQKWLRDTKGIDIEINNQFTNAKAGKWYFPTIYAEHRSTLSTHQNCSYESALLHGIKEALSLIDNN